MRIGYVLPDTCISGGVRVAMQQAHALRDRGHDAFVVTPGAPPDWLRARVPFVRADVLRGDALPDADVLVATYFTTVPAVHASGRALPVHLCQGYEGALEHLGDQGAAIEAAYRLPVPMLAVHAELARDVERRFGKPTAVVGQGVDPDEFSPNGRARAAERPFRVLISGPFEAPCKGVGAALAAVAALRTRGLDVEAVRVSQLPFGAAELEHEAITERHHGLTAEAMPALYRSCDAILAPCTAAEGFGLPVLEAIACGTPAVVTDVPCFRAFADQLDWAAVAPPGDPAALAAALERVLADTGERERLRSRGLEVAAAHRFDAVAERIEDALETWRSGVEAPPRPAPSQVAAPAVVLWHHEHTGQPEWAWAQRCAVRDGEAELGAGGLTVVRSAQPPSLGELLACASGALVGAALDDGAMYPWGTWGALAAALAGHDELDLVAPVANEGSVAEARVSPPYAYTTLSQLAGVAAERRRQHGAEVHRLDAVDPFAWVARRSALERLDPALPATEVPAALDAVGIALGTYVHRWTAILAQPRPDLLAEVPPDAASVLDVGCATGALCAALREQRDVRVVGLEADPELAAVAHEHADHVVEADVETLPADAFGAEFDCIVCGDVLEHLRDPWATVEKLRGWLRPGGRLVTTVPNVGHWSIVRDLQRGRLDYVPYGLMCWSHIRFFTRGELEDMLRQAGFEIERIEAYRFDLPPEGEAFIATLAAADAQADIASLTTYEHLVVARG